MEYLDTPGSAELLAVRESGLRDKVSIPEVDPAIRNLNEGIGVARERMQRASQATSEAWDAAQKDASEAFEKLQRDAAELTKRLKQELGLDKSKEG